jgi:hypothetical protein
LVVATSAAISEEFKQKEKHLGCTIPLFNDKDKKSNCSGQKKSKVIAIPKVQSDVKEQLSLIVYKYQAEHSPKDKKVKEQLNIIKKEFIKERIKPIKPLSKKKKNLKKKKYSKSKKRTIKRVTRPKVENLPKIEHLSWVDIVTEKDITIHQLAQLYYGDRKKYIFIYAANKNRIGDNYKISNGTSLRIPITADFKEQPMFLNTD